MKTLPSLQQYLDNKGVTNDTMPDMIEAYRKEYKRLYHRLYAQKRRQEKVRFENTLTKAEYRKLKSFAKRYRRKSLNRFMLDCAFAYLENEYIDHNPELTLALGREIRAIGNNVNQVVHQLHRTRDYQNKNFYELIRDQIKTLQLVVKDFLSHPPNLKTELETLFQQIPESIHDFEHFLETMKAKHLEHDSKKH